jgi:hypothetical protein
MAIAHFRVYAEFSSNAERIAFYIPHPGSLLINELAGDCTPP